MRKYLFLIFLFGSLFAEAQDNPAVDSLETILPGQTSADRLNTLLALTGETRFYDLEKAYEYAAEAEILSLELNERTQYGRALYYQGMINYYRGFLHLGMEYADKGASVFAEVRDSIRLSACYELLGVIHTDLVNDEQAISYLRKVLEIAEKQGDDYGIISSNSNIGNIYLRQKNRKLARNYYRQALEVMERTEDPSAFSEVYLNLAAVTDNRDDKMSLYETSREGFSKNGMTEGEGQVLSAMGRDFMEQGKQIEAVDYFRKSVAAFRGFGFDNGVAGTKILLAEALEANRNYAEAERELLSAIQLAKGKELNEHLMRGYEVLAHFYENRGNTAQALTYYKLFGEQKERNFNEVKSKAIAENEAKYQSEKKELQLAEQELEIGRERAIRIQIIWWFILGLLVTAGILGFYYFRQQRQRILAENALHIKNLEAENLKERERIKSAFFANISHEFRTPLTLIISPLKEMISGTFQGDPAVYFKMMLRNGQRLLDLVNQLLDLAKLEMGSLELQPEEGDINGFLKGVASSFESLSEIRGIRFFLTAPIGASPARFDKDKLQKILSNLLSNAFKFTPEGGEVRMEISSKGNDLVLDISDSGLGIPPADLPFVFERFYQVKDLNKAEQVGSGIGLALVKELVDLHGGGIKVRSKTDEGTHFNLILPGLLMNSTTSGESVLTEHNFSIQIDEGQREVNTKGTRPQVLIAEDHGDVQKLIRDVLSSDYDVLLAKDGEEATRLALRTIPDAVISDVMMPKKDGYALCEELKTDPKTSHIPIIMLTARAEQEDKMRGLETGADAYLPKPFDAAELKLRLKNLINLRQRLRQDFSTAISLKPEEIQVSSVDRHFIEQVKEIIDRHVSDEQFGVDIFASEIGMSRSQLNRKLRAIFNQSANEMVRIYRLERAHQLLSKRAMTPTEASYQLGFSSPAYFSKCFSDHYGYPPSRVG
ncbi:response regulator [Marinilongibacter aquaticus]|uniref:ATP-binding protein n=1 Tax=Marinilongibacter aquaticus TaxID=2975157 RepID=UPI0021BD12AC|nr:ATP-binding protein [Marinilongibacter aquaticus]UBM58743.1 response regulator [Marinilongibacter aquaticus]